MELPQKQKREFFVELESARGIAALLVAGFHCALTPVVVGGTESRLCDLEDGHGFWQVCWDVYAFFIAYTGWPYQSVLFFFALSGFLLTDSLLRGPKRVAPAAGRFFLARLFRIYPAIVATILVFWVFHVVAGLHLDAYGFTLRSILRNLLLLDVNIDGAMWTIQVEFLALPLIFLAFLLKTRAGLMPVVLFALTLAAMTFSGRWLRLFTESPPTLTGFLVIFLIGALGYHLGRTFCPGLSKGKTAAILFLSLSVILAIGVFIHNAWEMLFKAVAAALVTALLAFGPQIPATALLRLRPVRFLGRVSYSFYLLHPLSLTVVYYHPAVLGNWLEKGLPRVVLAFGLWVVSALAILPLAWLMYRVIEMPFIRYGKRLWRGASEAEQAKAA